MQKNNNHFVKLEKFIAENRNAVYSLFRNYMRLNKPFLLHSDMNHVLDEFITTKSGKILKESSFTEMMRNTQVAVISSPWMYMYIRPDIAKQSYYRFHVDDVTIEEISASAFLSFQERFIGDSAKNWSVELDLTPFNRGLPKLSETKSIGRGVEFLNRYLSNRLFSDLSSGDKKLLEFLRVHQHKGQQLMLTQQIQSVDELRDSLRGIIKHLKTLDKQTVWNDVIDKMLEFGFERGWGRTVGDMLDSFNLLSDIIEAPDPKPLSEFLSRIPMIFSVVILSPHGYFGQANVLGLPDTGGQVVYILDQVRAMEQEMRQRIYDQGLDIEPQIIVITRQIPEAGNTTCNQVKEDIIGTKNAKILRVPFKSEQGDIINHWISRFKIWPYLEQFAIDTEKEILSEMQGKPDLIIGNYSDGNLVASILSQRLGVTQCNIAHALEKTKYLFSDLYWKEHDDQYHFSSQFTADLIAMNTADFIITSTYQEIAGNEHSQGQYESYSTFTMPDLYRVINGINVYDPKFNIVSPGADADVYFPFTDKKRRFMDLHPDIEKLIYDQSLPYGHGFFKDDDKPIIFAMSRLDYVKNISGLVEWFGKNKELQELANLFIVAGFVDELLSADDEEKEQVRRLHSLISEYQLSGHIRWVEKQSYKNFNGEMYRYIADKNGVFVQPALFEAFGLTVIEAMSSGLPTFATQYGGPLEIIEDGVSGFHIAPDHGDQVSRKLVEFFKKCRKDPDHWDKISKAAIRRVEERYTWKLYASRLMNLSRIYGFWKYVSNLERDETRRYLEMFYGLMYRPLVEKMG
ncbi:MAG: sucrose synthase [Calditrichaeota bacterium]|nr:sucrose synthase [Calditrichota bacterium]